MTRDVIGSDRPVVVDGLVKRFGATTALGGISFDVRPREIFGFIGPDGAGKTTLFRVLVTLLLPDEGRAQLLGLDVTKELWQIRRRVGYMPGRFSLYPDLSVDENIAFFASVFGTTHAAGNALIEPIYRQLAEFRHRRAGALSGGMKQKLALCCALVHRPEILLLDEPTTGVDAVSRREFWGLLGRLRDDGLTIVVSTPYMDEASRCDRVALIDRGQFLAVDTPRAITSAFERPLLAVRGSSRYGLLQATRRYENASTVFPFGEALHYTDGRAMPAATIADELLQHLRDNGFADATVESVEPSIEDAFMARMAPSAAMSNES